MICLLKQLFIFHYLFIKFLSAPLIFIISKPHFGVIFDYSEIIFIINRKPPIYYIGDRVTNKTHEFMNYYLKKVLPFFI